MTSAILPSTMGMVGVYHRILTFNQAIQRSFSGCAKPL